MNYSKLSDFEINGMVASLTQSTGDHTQTSNETFIHEYADIGEINGLCIGWKKFDPCNNPADAWPIIVANGISLNHYTGTWEASYEYDAPIGAFGTDEAVTSAIEHKNPLRAAMIAFLLMQESQHA